MPFTTRLDKKQEKQLDKIMQLIEVNTRNKAIIEMIKVYEADQNELRELRQKTRSQHQELSELKRLFQERERLSEELARRLSD